MSPGWSLLQLITEMGGIQSLPELHSSEVWGDEGLTRNTLVTLKEEVIK